MRVSSDLEDENDLMAVKAHRYGGLGEWRLMFLLLGVDFVAENLACLLLCADCDM
jgi:hypothetical protein